ncbi:MAG TPA: flavodoxin-dependent (E)-4-hydroxy-3-methylbut-2-enyl-diphosphate synthase, partial [Candidatus Kryptobacter bacterium]|nr:flavodoxin-dependent (E)-4-hydroxy-3-methylbut-2-enyl-diphosphate synthase [Candidatus Kryptobacter bacterium]
MIELPVVSNKSETAASHTAEVPLNFKYPVRKSRKVFIGKVPVGGGSPISVQTMTKTKTSDIDATVRQIVEAADAGCDI